VYQNQAGMARSGLSNHTGELGNGAVLAARLLLAVLLVLLCGGQIGRRAISKLLMTRVPASQRTTETVAENDSGNRRLTMPNKQTSSSSSSSSSSSRHHLRLLH